MTDSLARAAGTVPASSGVVGAAPPAPAARALPLVGPVWVTCRCGKPTYLPTGGGWHQCWSCARWLRVRATVDMLETVQ